MSSGLCVLGHGLGANGEPLNREAEHGLLCPHHRRSLDHLTRDVRDLWYDLTFILEAGTGPKDETPRTRHLKAAEAPAPANLEALALRDAATHGERLAGRAYCHQCGDIGYGPPIQQAESAARYAQWAANLHTVRTGHRAYVVDGDNSDPLPPVLSVVASWLLLVAEERPLTADKLPQSVIAQLQLLDRHADWIAGQPWVDDYATELGDLRKALRLAVRDVTHHKIGRCRLPAEEGEGACGGTLIRENGAESVKCVQCGAQWTSPQELARLSLSLEAK